MARVTGISFKMGGFHEGFSRLDLFEADSDSGFGTAVALPRSEFTAVADEVLSAMGGGWYRLYGRPGVLDGECWELVLCWDGEWVHRYSGCNDFPDGFDEVLGIMERLGFPEGWSPCEGSVGRLVGEYEHLWLHAHSLRGALSLEDGDYLEEARGLEDDVALFVERNPRFCHYYDIIEARGVDIEGIWSGYDPSSLDAECIAALVVAAWRADHFSPGAFLSMIADGTVIRWLERLRDAHLNERG